MIEIDSGMLFSAVEGWNQLDPLQDVGYLNRHTGEIVFLSDSDEESARWYGVPVEQFRADRARVAQAPEDWLEIPKNTWLPVFHEHWCERRTTRPREYWTPCTCGALERAQALEVDNETFIRDFLRENGIDAKWV
jgi:hypothetical protein